MLAVGRSYNSVQMINSICRFVEQNHIAIEFELEMCSDVYDIEYRINIKWGTSR
ncbi:MAG: hypothetical protein DID90_2727554335 [Candidatus Nitrotoga sp. LAW]|nr:MAG: hypothetical protein DID90_2727554335 [Candidatus Nitrotoga sp. LAW]